MSASTSAPAPGSGSKPAPRPTPSVSRGGGVDDDEYSPLLDLLERYPDLFHTDVLGRLDLTGRTAAAGAGSAFRDVVFPIYIFPLGLPLSGGGDRGDDDVAAQETTGGVAVRNISIVRNFWST